VQQRLVYPTVATYLCQEQQQVSSTDRLTDSSVSIRMADAATFERVFREYHAMLCRYALTLLHDTDQAEEVVQDVFFKIWEKRESLTITSSIKSYLFRAIHNTAINLLVKKNKEIRMEDAPLKIVHQISPPVADMQTKEMEKAIANALQKLPEQCRKVFELSRFGELKYSEIAATLNISIKTVENQMGKALRIMRQELSSYMYIVLLLLLEPILTSIL
jgi:RNA polymerase sigma-70 factor (family 1)